MNLKNEVLGQVRGKVWDQVFEKVQNKVRWRVWDKATYKDLEPEREQILQNIKKEGYK